MEGYLEREFKLPWREAGPPNHHDDKVDSDQLVVKKGLSLWNGTLTRMAMIMRMIGRMVTNLFCFRDLVYSQKESPRYPLTGIFGNPQGGGGEDGRTSSPPPPWDRCRSDHEDDRKDGHELVLFKGLGLGLWCIFSPTSLRYCLP